MSAIKQALAKLDGVVGRLEGSAQGFERALAQGSQADMFSVPSNENGVDASLVAKKLDSAIRKIEAVLSDKG